LPAPSLAPAAKAGTKAPSAAARRLADNRYDGVKKDENASVVAGLVLPLPGSALADSYPTLMKKVDEILAANPKMDPEVLAEAKKVREPGVKRHKQGKHNKSVDELHQALFLLGQ